MLIKNEIYSVELSIDKDWNWLPEDRERYDYIYDLTAGKTVDNRDLYDTVSIFCTYNDKMHIRIAIAGCFCYSCIRQHPVVLEGDVLTLQLNSDIVQIALKDGQMLRHIDLDTIGFSPGDCFAIYSTKYGFIVYGELDIVMLNRELKVLWTFDGADIFALPDCQKDAFILHEDTVELYDWLGNYYEVRLASGELVRFIRAEGAETQNSC